MPDTQQLLLFMAAALALNITPGPDMLYVIARSSSEGRSAGIASALGIGAGTLFHIAALALGLSAVLAAVPVAYDVIRWDGAASLVWLGIRALRDAGRASERVTLTPASLGAIFRQGMLTNVLNPKVALFFLAFLPQFVDPARGNPALQVVALGLLFDLSGTAVNLVVALLASRVARWGEPGADGTRSTRTVVLRRLTGAIFIALGARLAFAGAR